MRETETSSLFRAVRAGVANSGYGVQALRALDEIERRIAEQEAIEVAARKLRQRVAFSPLTDGSRGVTERTMALYREATSEFCNALTDLRNGRRCRCDELGLSLDDECIYDDPCPK